MLVGFVAVGFDRLVCLILAAHSLWFALFCICRRRLVFLLPLQSLVSEALPCFSSFVSCLRTVRLCCLFSPYALPPLCLALSLCSPYALPMPSPFSPAILCKSHGQSRTVSFFLFPTPAPRLFYHSSSPRGGVSMGRQLSRRRSSHRTDGRRRLAGRLLMPSRWLLFPPWSSHPSSPFSPWWSHPLFPFADLIRCPRFFSGSFILRSLFFGLFSSASALHTSASEM